MHHISGKEVFFNSCIQTHKSHGQMILKMIHIFTFNKTIKLLLFEKYTNTI